MSCNELENPRKYTFSVSDRWTIEVIERSRTRMHSAEDPDYFNTNWVFIATIPPSSWCPELGENRLTGMFSTDYDIAPDRFDVIKGVADTLKDDCIEMARYMEQD